MKVFYDGATRKNVISLVLLLVGLGSLVYFRRDDAYRLVTEAVGTRANLVVAVNVEQGELKKPWLHLAQGGEDLAVNMLEPVSEQLKNLSPASVRIDHIFDGYGVVSRGEEGELVFDWARLDEVVETIGEVGAVPMFSLSYMPPVLSGGDIVGPPEKWEEWALVVQKTIEHYSGEMDLEGVSYEVWNEPDLFGDWKTNGDKNYLELYKWSVVGAEAAEGVKPFEIGGPATTSAFSHWLTTFLEFVEENRLRIDFVSWHRYSKNISDFGKEIPLVLGAVTKSPLFQSRGFELFITESGPTGDNDEVYDSNLGAAHLVAMAREVMDHVDRVYTFEIVDGKDPNGNKLWGRWGLLTHPDFEVEEKPRYQAFQFLENLSGSRVTVLGEGTWVKAIATKDNSDVVRVLAVNYDRYGKHVETVPIVVQGLSSGEYIVKKSFLDGGLSEETVAVSDSGAFEGSVTLPANGVVLVEIRASSLNGVVEK